ncbi:unnamed protein product [Arabidopsis thaliana]|uniref:(thale cress) hypothetical protein n=1 Tax=Arabidopsis thaliana TaxID=3702 RepID=A0A7G2EBV9_ARATH|nr:unnamed protein product [Arabidopsis thaliana]
MFRSSPRRGQRSKGFKVKHCIQLTLLLSVGIWLLYQVKHSHEKKAQFEESAKIVVGGVDKVVKLGRKDLIPRVVEVDEAEDEGSKNVVESFNSDEKANIEEARENNYKGDDASSEVVHESEEKTSESENSEKVEDKSGIKTEEVEDSVIKSVLPNTTDNGESSSDEKSTGSSSGHESDSSEGIKSEGESMEKNELLEKEFNDSNGESSVTGKSTGSGDGEETKEKETETKEKEESSSNESQENVNTESEKKEQVEENEKKTDEDTSESSKENSVSDTEQKQSEETSEKEESNKNGETEVTQEQSDSSSDTNLPQEVKDVRTDLETLPDSGNGGSNESVAAE